MAAKRKSTKPPEVTAEDIRNWAAEKPKKPQTLQERLWEMFPPETTMPDGRTANQACADYVREQHRKYMSGEHYDRVWD